jgi:superfamily II DNA or RNA helicase
MSATAPPHLRDYQLDIIADIAARVATGRKRVLAVLPTGGGKTIVFAEIVRRTVADSRRVVVLVHRRELLGQASRKLYDAGIDHGIVAAGFSARPGEPVQVCMVPTLHQRAVRTSAMELPPADVAVVDEAHHSPANSWKAVIASWPEAMVLGLTATPCRKNGAGLGTVFDALVEGPQVAELIERGFLVGTVVFAAPPPDLTGVPVHKGDYAEGQLAERVDRPKLVGDVVAEWHRHAKGLPTIAFATNVAHSVHIRDAFRTEGILAEHLDGSTPTAERDRILKALAEGKVDVVSNCAVLTEGFDAPNVGCIILARPTRSFGLYRQMIGRGLRTAEGKTHCIVLDHAGATVAHGFVEEPAQWSLDEGSRAQSKPAGLTGGRARRLRDCPECGAVDWEGKPCTACGWHPVVKPEPIATIDGDLEELKRDGTRKPIEIDPRGFYRELRGFAGERGFKQGWAAHKFKDKFKQWPPYAWNSDAPVEPSPEVRSWVRSRFIAYKAAMRKAVVQS